MSFITRAAPALLPLCVGLTAAVCASAQAYPSKPIRTIVPFAPGGVTDTSSRVVAERLSVRLSQQVFVEDKPGALGNSGAQILVNTKPDGYTLLLGLDGTLVVAPNLQARMPFDTLKDLAPVSKNGDAILILGTRPSVLAENLQELIAYSKTKPGGLSYCTAGTSTTPNLADALLADRTVEQAMTALVGGQMPVVCTAVAGAHQFVKNGQIEAALPEVPTVSEPVVPDFESSSWFGILALAGPPVALIDRLQKEIHVVVQEPETPAGLTALGVSAEGTIAAEYGAQIKAELAKYADVRKSANIEVY